MLSVFLRPQPALLVRPDCSLVQFSMEIWGTLEPTPCHTTPAPQCNSQNLELYTMGYFSDAHLISSPTAPAALPPSLPPEALAIQILVD